MKNAGYYFDRITRVVSVAAVLVFPAMSCAQDVSWYQVEVIVFSYAEPDLDRELWYQNPGWPQHGDSIELVDRLPDAATDMTREINLPEADPGVKPPPVAYQALPEKNYRLENDFRRLRLSSLYRPLLHVAWQQPGLAGGKVRYVHLVGSAEVTAAQPAAGEQAGALPQPAAGYTPPVPVFDGLVRLRVPSFIYVDVDFSYFPDDLQALLDQQLARAGDQYAGIINRAADYVRLQESRRIYLNELNYFDHPLFGILLQVSRVEEE